MKKVLLLENIDQFATDYFLDRGYTVQTSQQAMTVAELRDAIKKIDILGIRSKTTITKEVIGSAHQLKAIGAFCIGLDQIDLQACAQENVAVFNAPFSNTRSVAELVIGEIIMLYRGIFEKSMKLHRGNWQKTAVGSHEIRGKVLGIIGYGNIGKQVSILAEAMGMSVIFYDIADTLSIGNAQRCLTMEELLKNSDVISVHVDGRKENASLIGQNEFSWMKTGVIFLNLSRGKIVDQVALRDALIVGKVAGAAVDVFPEEPSKNGEGFNSVLQHIPNVILTPHIAGSTGEAQLDIASYVSRKLDEYVQQITEK